jgi:hypothetical protein
LHAVGAVALQVVDGSADDRGVILKLAHAGVTTPAEYSSYDPAFMVMVYMLRVCEATDRAKATLSFYELEKFFKADPVPSAKPVVSVDQCSDLDVPGSAIETLITKGRSNRSLGPSDNKSHLCLIAAAS